MQKLSTYSAGVTRGPTELTSPLMVIRKSVILNTDNVEFYSSVSVGDKRDILCLMADERIADYNIKQVAK